MAKKPPALKPAQTGEIERSEEVEDGLDLRQDKALAALLLGKTNREAGRAAGAAESTVRRWRKDPLFIAAYRARRSEVVSDAIAGAQRLCKEAVDTLGELMRDTNQPGAVRTSAAKLVLDVSLKAVELEDLKTRIEALEAREEEGDDA